jgi:hypothetical protein
MLAAPSSRSRSKMEHDELRTAKAVTALGILAQSTAFHPDTHSGQHLLRFIWSIWDGHHALNLWRMKDVRDSRNRDAVGAVFTTWMDDYLGEDAIREALLVSGELNRWDTGRLWTPDQKWLIEAFDAVTHLLNTTPPRAPDPTCPMPTNSFAKLGSSLETVD